MKQATYLHYSEDRFTDWGERVGATPGKWIAMDVHENKLIKEWDEPLDDEQLEQQLNELGYSVGFGGQND